MNRLLFDDAGVEGSTVTMVGDLKNGVSASPLPLLV